MPGELCGQSRREVLCAVDEAGGLPHPWRSGEAPRAGFEHGVSVGELAEGTDPEAFDQRPHAGFVTPEPGRAQVDGPSGDGPGT